MEYRSTIGKPLDHTSKHPTVKLPIAKTHKTLNRIKKDFEGTPLLFVCVVEGHFQTPAALIQFIVECPTVEEYNRVKERYSDTTRYNLFYEYHPEFTWVTDIPKQFLKERFAL